MLTRSGLDIVVGRALGTVLLTVRGALTAAAAQELGHAIDQAVREHPERLVVDLTGVSSLTDEGLETLEQASKAADAAGVQLQLTSRVKAVLSRLSDRDVNLA